MVVLDNAIAPFAQRFEQMQEFRANFGFIFATVSAKGGIDENELKANGLNLQKVLSSRAQPQSHSNTVSLDTDGISLCDELKALHNNDIIADSVCSILELLRFLQVSHSHKLFPTVSSALRVLLTIPITAASGERSFSKLKLIKTYL